MSQLPSCEAVTAPEHDLEDSILARPLRLLRCRHTCQLRSRIVADLQSSASGFNFGHHDPAGRPCRSIALPVRGTATASSSATIPPGTCSTNRGDTFAVVALQASVERGRRERSGSRSCRCRLFGIGEHGATVQPLLGGAGANTWASLW